MSRQHDSMIEPNIEALLGKVESKFGLVTLASQRARNINEYFNQLGQGLGKAIPPQVSSTARKPLSIAFEEIAAERIVRIDLEEVEEDAGVDDEAEATGDEFGSDQETAADEASAEEAD